MKSANPIVKALHPNFGRIRRHGAEPIYISVHRIGQLKGQQIGGIGAAVWRAWTCNHDKPALNWVKLGGVWSEVRSFVAFWKRLWWIENEGRSPKFEPIALPARHSRPTSILDERFTFDHTLQSSKISQSSIKQHRLVVLEMVYLASSYRHWIYIFIELCTNHTLQSHHLRQILDIFTLNIREYRVVRHHFINAKCFYTLLKRQYLSFVSNTSYKEFK